MVTKLLIGVVCIVSFLFLLPSYAFASDYYVSVTGNDQNSGTLPFPFKTIQKGVDKAVNPGDQVLVMPGEYTQSGNYIYGEPVHIENKHGELGKTITLKAFDPMHRPVLRGFTGIEILASSFITIDGFEITDTVHSAIGLSLSDNVTVKNNYIHLDYEGNCGANETGVYAGCTYYPGLGIGHIKGRHNKNGDIIVEHDGSQNTGIYLCKTINSTFSNNKIENLDEGIYAGKAGNVEIFNCWDDTIPPKYDYIYKDGNRKWVEGNTFSENLILDAWNEAIELKSDTRFNVVRGNVTLSTRQFVESSQIEIRGHDNEILENMVVGSPNLGIRVLSENVSDPNGDRVEAYKKTDGSYMSAYRNNVHHNYIYSWAQYSPSAYGIGTSESSAANIIAHNTIVGINEFSGKVSEYASIKSNSYPESQIVNNLMVGLRRVDYTSGSEKYEYHLTSYANYLPTESDYNAYFPKLKSNNTACVVSIGSLGIVCQNGNSHNASVGYEFHSKFLDTNPLPSDEPCSKSSLLTLPIEDIKNRILYCSKPVAGSVVLSAAEGGGNIGAYQDSITTPTLSPTISPIQILGDANSDGEVDGMDYVVWLNHYDSLTTSGRVDGDFDTSGKVDGVDYVIWLTNYSN